MTDEEITNLYLLEIEKLLRAIGKCLSDYDGMPKLEPNQSFFTQNRLICAELAYNRSELKRKHEQLFIKLNDEQRKVYDSIKYSVDSNKGGVFFVYGYGGMGKTYLWRTLSAALRSKGKIVLNVASSGIASLLLPGGRTAHSRFVIPINITEDSTCNIKQGSQLAELLVRCRLIIWDEAPMVHRHCIEALDNMNVDILEDLHTTEFWNSLKCSGVPNHKLTLKVGTPVMLLRNINHSRGLCNGTRLVLTRLDDRVLEGRVITGSKFGELVLIPRLSLTPSDPRLSFKFQRRQFPLIVSYAMSINKSQGQSLANVGIYLKKSVFSHGQLYVAVSRVTNRKGLKILVCDDDERSTNKTKNVIFKEVFRNV